MNLHLWKKTVYCLLAAIAVVFCVPIAAVDESSLALSLSFGLTIVILALIAIGSLKFGRCPHCSYLLGRDFYLYGMAHCPRCGRRI